MKKGLLMVVLAVAVCVMMMGATFGWSQAKGPVKIGFITTLTGPTAANGKDMLAGLQVYLDEIGYQAAGRKIELIVEDDEGAPAVALTKGRKLVEKDGVHVVTGLLAAAAGYALVPYVDSKEIPTTLPVTSGDDLTQRKGSKWVIRTGWTSSQVNQPFGEYAYKTLKYRNVSIIGFDMAFGWECAAGFQKTFEELGGKVRQKIWVPMTVADFSPFLPQFPKDIDAVYTVLSGRAAMQFVKQYQEYGLKSKIPVLGGTITDEHVLPSMGDEALGIVTALHYSEALDNPANKKFVKGFREKAKKPASYYSEGTYTGGRWIVEAIKAIQGDVENRGKFLEGLRKVELKDLPRGPMKLDAYYNPIQNVYIRKVERIGGELQNTVIHTYPNVSQFWKYKPEEFLKQPVYSREFPPLKP